MRSTLQCNLSQQLKISPRLQQAIRLLPMSGLELEQEIENLLKSNLLLEKETNTAEATLSVAEMPYFHRTSSGESKDTFLLQKPIELTLKAHLYEQLALLSFSKTERLIAEILIDAILEDGYLSCSLTEVQEILQSTFSLTVPLKTIESVLNIIQTFDPIGVGARNLSECLGLQLNHLPDTTAEKDKLLRLASNHLELLAEKNYTKLYTILNINPEEFKKMVKLLTTLDPKPGLKISADTTDTTGIIIPDVIVKKENTLYHVLLNNPYLPRLRINTDYANLRGFKKNEKQKASLLKEHFKEAQWFLKSLETRHETLLKVTRAIIQKQMDFLEKGPAFMKPLTLATIAQTTGLHESTVSRITTEKYILMPRGMFELKYFFSRSLPQDQGTSTSNTAIRAMIKEIIAKETSQNPVSDHKIKILLQACGISIARRTVTKYREAMGVPSSLARKNLGFC